MTIQNLNNKIDVEYGVTNIRFKRLKMGLNKKNNNNDFENYFTLNLNKTF